MKSVEVKKTGVINPPAMLGMLGGGQLGRFFCDCSTRDGLPSDRAGSRSK
jgi:hypothetical protein